MPELWTPDTPTLITLDEREIISGGSIHKRLIAPHLEQPSSLTAFSILMDGGVYDKFVSRYTSSNHDHAGYAANALLTWEFRKVVIARLLGSIASINNMPCATKIQEIEHTFLEGNTFQTPTVPKKLFRLIGKTAATLGEPDKDDYIRTSRDVRSEGGQLPKELTAIKAGFEVSSLMSIRTWAITVINFLNDNQNLFKGNTYTDFTNKTIKLIKNSVMLQDQFQQNPTLKGLDTLFLNANSLLEAIKAQMINIDSPLLDIIKIELEQLTTLLAEIKITRFMGHVVTVGNKGTGIISATILPYNMGELDETPPQEHAKKSPEDLARLREEAETARRAREEATKEARRAREEAEEAARLTRQEEDKLKKQDIQALLTKYGLSISGRQSRKLKLKIGDNSLSHRMKLGKIDKSDNDEDYEVYAKVIHCLATICKTSKHNHEEIKAKLETMIEEFEAFWVKYKLDEPNKRKGLETEEIDLLKIQEILIWIKSHWPVIRSILEQSDGYVINEQTINSIGMLFSTQEQSLKPQSESADQISLTAPTAGSTDQGDTEQKPTISDLFAQASELDLEVFPPDTITIAAIERVISDHVNNSDETREPQSGRIHIIKTLADLKGGTLYYSKENKNTTLGDLYFILVFKSDGKTFAIAENPFEGNATYIFSKELLRIEGEDTILDMLGFQRTQLRPLKGCEFVIHVDEDAPADHLDKINTVVIKLSEQADQKI